MPYEELLKLLPYLVAFASLVVSAILGIANYQISRGNASLEKERLAHDKAMVYWDKKVTVYSNVWAAATTAYEGYLNWQVIADDPREQLRKWAVIRTVREKGSQREIDKFNRQVQEDPNYWLGWLLEGRKPNFEELEAEVRKQSFFLSPLHRELVVSIFDACTALRHAKTTAEFTSAYYDHLELVKSKYRELNNEIDRTFYPAESTHPTGPQ